MKLTEEQAEHLYNHKNWSIKCYISEFGIHLNYENITFQDITNIINYFEASKNLRLNKSKIKIDYIKLIKERLEKLDNKDIHKKWTRIGISDILIKIDLDNYIIKFRAESIDKKRIDKLVEVFLVDDYCIIENNILLTCDIDKLNKEIDSWV